MPPHVHKATDLATAVFEAEEQGRPILYVQTDIEGGSQSTWNWTKEIIENSTRRGVVVVVVEPDTLQELPAKVKSGINNKELGTALPRLLLAGSRDETIYMAIGRDDIRGKEREVFREFDRLAALHRRKMRDAEQEEARKAFDTQTPAPETRTWTNSDGQVIHAVLIWVESTTVRLRRDDDRVFDIPLDQLSNADQSYVEDYHGTPYDRR